MSRINTNVTSLIGQRVLTRNQADLNRSLARLSTGIKINSGSDDPAGLIASENLRGEKVGTQSAIDNASRASNVIGTAEGGLNEVSALLTQLQGLVSQASNTGGLSQPEVAANQLQVDSILGTINRISGSTSFQGIQLLNGNYDYNTSGLNPAAIANLRVNSAKIPDGAAVNVLVNVAVSARTAVITYSGSVPAGGATVQVAGNFGTTQLSFASGTTISQVRDAINAVRNATGLSAQVSGAAVRINSVGYGSKQFVSLTTIAGTFNPSITKAYGRDATTSVNGGAAISDGTRVSYRTSDLDVEFDIRSLANKNGGSSSFFITGGGATFGLGSKVTEGNKASIGIQSVSTASLGNVDDGFLSSLASGAPNSLNSGQLVRAQRVLDTAIRTVSQLRGRLGAFQKYTIQSTVNNLGVALENSSAAESAIRDTDFAAETASLTRAQILQQASTTVLSQANSAPQSVLSLLRAG
jgi:flagellin